MIDMIAGIKLKMGHVTLTMPFIGFSTFYLCAIFDDSSLSRSRYIIGPKN